MMNEVKTYSDYRTLVVLHYKDKIKLVVVVEDKDLKKVFNFINTQVIEHSNPQSVVAEVLKKFDCFLDVCRIEKNLSAFPEARMIHISITEDNNVRLYSDSVCEVTYDFF